MRGTRTSLGRWVRTGYRGHPGEKANPLFLQRPEWLRLATCFSAYGLCPFYLLIGEGLGHWLGLGWRGAAVRVTAERPQPQPQPQPSPLTLTP